MVGHDRSARITAGTDAVRRRGGGAVTVRVNACVASGTTPLEALMVKVYVPCATDGSMVIRPVAALTVTVP